MFWYSVKLLSTPYCIYAATRGEFNLSSEFLSPPSCALLPTNNVRKYTEHSKFHSSVVERDFSFNKIFISIIIARLYKIAFKNREISLQLEFSTFTKQ